MNYNSHRWEVDSNTSSISTQPSQYNNYTSTRPPPPLPLPPPPSGPTSMHAHSYHNQSRALNQSHGAPLNVDIMNYPEPPTSSPQKKKSTAKKISAGQASPLPHHKAGRVKVAIRCRPPFQDEVEAFKGNFYSIVNAIQDYSDQVSLGRILLTMSSGKQREFLFDKVFGPNIDQDTVYEQIAKPVVTDVLRGFNGTIFAYGQTGTGKTYTMGILETIRDEHAGIIPRALSQIFSHLREKDNRNMEFVITMSFLQIYRENIQDLLSAEVMNALNNGHYNESSAAAIYDENLPIREDPIRGFYVEGLQEYNIQSFREAEALINCGLRNRALAPTLMNTTSSRSHTVLTINIEQHGDSAASATNGYFGNRNFTIAKTIRSKLLLVDLAGSERVRKTVSKGARLDEAKSINTSLSALGNVIAALAEPNVGHVPYRDSKLTRILNDSLGGTASTVLIATIGPAPSNYNETLSTLQFASRCMSVKSTPVQHEEIDFAEMCAKLQEQLSIMEGEMSRRLSEQQEKYEDTIKDLKDQVKKKKPDEDSMERVKYRNSQALSTFLKYIDNNKGTIWRWMNDFDSMNKSQGNNFSLPVIICYCYDVMKDLYKLTCTLILSNKQQEDERLSNMSETHNLEEAKEKIKLSEVNAMEKEDPLRGSKNFKNIGSHLAPLSKLDAMTRVQTAFPSNNVDDNGNGASVLIPKVIDELRLKEDVTDFNDPQELATVLSLLQEAIEHNMQLVSQIMQRKDAWFGKLQGELVNQMVEKRKREEEVLNWSYILKYLLQQTSELKSQIKSQRKNLFDERRSMDFATNPPPMERKEFSTFTNPTLTTDANNRTNMIEPPSPPAERDFLPEPPKEQQTLSPLDIIQDRIKQAANVEMEQKKRRSQAGKLGPRLFNSSQAVQHNNLVMAEIDQIDDEFDAQSYETASTGRNKTPTLIPSAISDREHDDRNFMYKPKVTVPPSVSASYPAPITSVKYQPAFTPTTSAAASAASAAHSKFARTVVKSLDVDDEEADAAMEVVDKISSITQEQLRKMDPATREQVLQVRKQLGLDKEDGLMAPTVNRKNEPKGSDLRKMHDFGPRSGSYSANARRNYDSDDEVFSQLDDWEI